MGCHSCLRGTILFIVSFLFIFFLFFFSIEAEITVLSIHLILQTEFWKSSMHK